jgi:hypothetical protein
MARFYNYNLSTLDALRSLIAEHHTYILEDLKDVLHLEPIEISSHIMKIIETISEDRLPVYEVYRICCIANTFPYPDDVDEVQNATEDPLLKGVLYGISACVSEGTMLDYYEKGIEQFGKVPSEPGIAILFLDMGRYRLEFGRLLQHLKRPLFADPPDESIQKLNHMEFGTIADEGSELLWAYKLLKASKNHGAFLECALALARIFQLRGETPRRRQMIEDTLSYLEQIKYAEGVHQLVPQVMTFYLNEDTTTVRETAIRHWSY